MCSTHKAWYDVSCELHLWPSVFIQQFLNSAQSMLCEIEQPEHSAKHLLAYFLQTSDNHTYLKCHGGGLMITDVWLVGSVPLSSEGSDAESTAALNDLHRTAESAQTRVTAGQTAELPAYRFPDAGKPWPFSQNSSLSSRASWERATWHEHTRVFDYHQGNKNRNPFECVWVSVFMLCAPRCPHEKQLNIHIKEYLMWVMVGVFGKVCIYMSSTNVI